MSVENGKISILVVDDEQGMRDLLKMELDNLGYHVSTAGDGKEALALIEKESFQLVITDIMMPHMDGIQLLAEIRKRDSYMEVIVTTGYGQIENAVTAMKSGAYDFIQKPYGTDQILSVVEKALEKSQLKRTRDAALEASRAKSEFLATMSHEIRTPLNAIVGMAELLSESTLSKEQHEYVQILKRGGDTLLSLINDILDLSKVESGCLELEEVQFDLQEFMERTMEFMAMRSHQKGLELASHIDPKIPPMLAGDSNRLRQVLINLLGNAIKFTEQGEIVINVVLAENSGKNEGECRLRFSVKDTGIGIPADKVFSVFNPFTQVDSSTTRKYGGTGLGLSISKKLVEFMGGRIWLTSQMEKGTTFYFEIPFRIQKVSQKPQTAALSEVDLKMAKTLVVDDNSTNRFIIKEALMSWGISADEVEDGEACLKELKRAKMAGEPYHLVLLDCRMPEMDGFQVADAIKKDADFSNSVVMMLTSDSRQGDIARSKALGLAGYMVKPVKRADLYEAIKIALGKSSSASTRTLNQENVPAAPVKINQESGKRILVVEDTEDNRILIQFFMKGTPHEIDYAENGVVAVQKAMTKKYDLIFMDMNMPVMDGLEATRTIRKWESEQKCGAVPIIALTANALKEGLQLTLDAGCDAYLTKPVKKMVLLETIVKYTGPVKV